MFVGAVILTDSNYEMWYGGFNGGHWRIGYATSVLGQVSVQPSKNPIETFRLSQNFPNPFNPETKIEYTLAKRGKVILTIYNLHAGQVARFENGEQNAGNYEVTWNASGMASGIYFYRLQAGNFVQTRKMVLLK